MSVAFALLRLADVIRRVSDTLPLRIHLEQTGATKGVRRPLTAAEVTHEHYECRRQFASCAGAPAVLKQSDRVECFDRSPRKS
jgi:hypothetical protein